MTTQQKEMYRFKFRTLTDPPAFDYAEAGPFTPVEASMWGQMEAGKRVMRTGRAWVCDYGPVEVAPQPLISRDLLSMLVPGVIVSVVIIATAFCVKQYANEMCRGRSKNPENVTLCRGEGYAVSVTFDGIECGCRGAP